MYEHFKNDFLAEITNSFTKEQIMMVMITLDKVSYNYDIKEKCTDLVVYDSYTPKLLKTYIVCKKIEGLSETTLYNYNIALSNFFMIIKKKPEDVTANDIRVYLYTYQEQRKISNRSLDKLRQTICGFFIWLQNEGYVDNNISKKIPKIKYEEKPRCYLTQIELKQVRKVCKTKRELAIIETMYSTGCRVSELLNIKISDLDFNTKKVHLFGKGKKHRDSFLNAKSEISIKEYLKERNGNSEYIFVSERSPYNKLSRAGVEKIVKNIMSRTDIKKNITCHSLRHSMATTLAHNNIPLTSIQRILGHYSPTTTEIYLHMNMDTIQEQHARSII